ncbi:hypothetical protein BCR44DRAFT_76677 [Catenaria anguillulae PL171]|uniref:Ankyrin repeat-containing domain protein n=1 Tax=Catenaria anguillulae PL171 TaxID=765915 RepID=A0A1Y2HK52_9FUNG|nr:hypothetical protein BCR44DRAFT_76677 [Catenaria anguillulae PL171]
MSDPIPNPQANSNDSSRSRPTVNHDQLPRTRTPRLPTCLLELVLAFAPLVNPYSPISSPSLLPVLPRHTVPLAFRTLILIGNRHKATDNNPIRFARLINRAISSSDAISLAESLFSALCTDDYNRISFVNALSRAGKHTALSRLHALSLRLDDCWDAPAQSSAGGCLDTLKWWQSVLTIPDEIYDDEVGMDDEETVLAEAFYQPDEQVYRVTRNAAIKHGHVHILEYLRISLASYDWPFDGWEVASRYGHVHVLQWAKKTWRGGDPFSRWFHAIDSASASGHVHVLQWWIKNWKPEQLVYSVRAMDDASRNNHLDVLNWWSRSGLPLKFTPAAKTDALRLGHLDVVRFWLECGEYRFVAQLDSAAKEDDSERPVKIPPRVQDPDPVMLAAFGRLTWMKRALPNRYLRRETVMGQMCAMAAKFGHVHVLQHYGDIMAEGCLDVDAKFHPLVLAAEGGHLSCVQWLLTHLSQLGSPMLSWDLLFDGDMPLNKTLNAAAQKAIENGHVHVLEWMLANSSVCAALSPKHLVSHAWEKGSVSTLHLLLAEGYLHGRHMFAGLERAAAKGLVVVFEWCAHYNLSWTDSRLEWRDNQHPLAAALLHSQTDLLNWWLHHPGRIDWQQCTEDVVARLVVMRNCKSLRWLYEHAEAIRLSQLALRRIQDHCGQGWSTSPQVKLEF